MLKKILLTVGNILLGLNFGIIAGFSPIYLLVTMAFLEDPLDLTVMTVTSLITAVVTLIGTYIYSYGKKREHEEVNKYGMTLAISFAVGAIITAVFLFIYMGDPNNGAPNRLL